jgi:hypothetical protein
VKEAIRKDLKGNKNIAEKTEKYPTNTTFSFAMGSISLLKTDMNLKDQEEDLND